MDKNKRLLLIISEILEEKDFKHISEIELDETIDLIKDVLDKIEENRTFNINDIETREKIQNAIIILNKIYFYLLRYKNLKLKNNDSILMVRDINENEENEERHNLKIPKKTILIQEEDNKTKQKTR